MSGDLESLVFSVVAELADAGWSVTEDLVARRTKLSKREVRKTLTSLRRRGMIVPRRWGGSPGTFIPATRRSDVEGVPPEEM